MATTKATAQAAQAAETHKGYDMGLGPDGNPLPDFDKWDKIQTGFAPYWHPEMGKFCFGRVVAKDIRNPKFVRYLLVAACDHDCRRGPRNEDSEAGAAGEWVKVKAGQTFSITDYHSIGEELDLQLFMLMKYDIQFPVRILAEKKKKTNHPDGNRSVWEFDVRNEPKYTPLLTKHRSEYLKLKADEGEGREQIDA